MRSLRIGASANAKTAVREPTTLALLVVLPPFVVYVYGAAMAAFPDVGFFQATAKSYGRISGALFATAFLSGLVGLFGTVGAANADRYLAISGYSPAVLFGTRVLVSVGVAAAAAAVSLGALVGFGTAVAALPAAYLVLVLAGVIYSLVGVIVGAILPRELEGSLVLVFLADMDSFLSGNVLSVTTDLVAVLPLHYPHALFTAAVRDGAIPTGEAVAALAYLALLSLIAGVAYALATGQRWSL